MSTRCVGSGPGIASHVLTCSSCGQANPDGAKIFERLGAIPALAETDALLGSVA